MAPRWFSVRCVLRMEQLEQIDGQDDYAYEERITRWLADSFDTAIAMAESEAREYAEVLPPAEYIGMAQGVRAPSGSRARRRSVLACP